MPDLRLKELSVENFRSISGRCVVPLDGEITLIHGANGAGKTSLLSAIELVATGRVGYLDEQSDDAGSLLRNHEFPIGQVRLSLSENGHERTGVFDLADKVVGRPLLAENERSEFLERTFLPQTALARLLETYTETGKGVDNALVRFVKSLVGLDDLDSLIDGLEVAGHVARSKKLVPAWARALDDLDALEARISSVDAEVDTAERALREIADEARALLGLPDEGAHDAIVEHLRSRSRTEAPKEEELTQLEGLRAVIRSVSNMRAELGDQRSATQVEVEAARAADAANLYERWVDDEGLVLIDRLNKVRTEHLGLPEMGLPQLVDGYREARETLSAMQRAHQAASAADRERGDRVRVLDEQIRDLDATIRALEAEAQAIDVPTDVRIVIELLGAILPLVADDVCPVCDQEFIGAGALSDHIELKLRSLSDRSKDLVRIESAVASAKETRLAAVREAVLKKSLPPAADDVDFDSVVRIANGMEGAVERGARLRRNVDQAQVKAADARSGDAQHRVIAKRIAEVAEALDHPRAALPLVEPESTLLELVEERIQSHQYRETQRRWERGVLDSVQETNGRLEVLRAERADLRRQRDRLKKQVADAHKRMAQSRKLLGDAEQTRSRLINEVFDQSLNTLWAQLFSRFAPTERFVPKFVKQTKATRTVDVRLETQLPDGTTSGAPGAMLSYGNTNSAALSLFMAVHLSAPTRLPWLIFDDPVQSMDDIHIANFAAIVRQLAFTHGRQVVIAIHEPELFEYLSLELAPSRPDQTLVKVVLERGAGATQVAVDRVEHHREQQLAGSERRTQ
ncbi:AAA family ATPase [Microbacterium oleivorans]|uniref:Nuclease SbcCD subunit C n=1 Tax=Microbacterium oleivorans TaxID=273677 RepID=A0A031FVS0_9MICO|nr:AAA family ATPase [Microbacterium oleivorans]EZP28397.1 recombination protein F [Microbacterium oleivorans]